MCPLGARVRRCSNTQSAKPSAGMEGTTKYTKYSFHPAYSVFHVHPKILRRRDISSRCFNYMKVKRIVLHPWPHLLTWYNFNPSMDK